MFPSKADAAVLTGVLVLVAPALVAAVGRKRWTEAMGFVGLVAFVAGAGHLLVRAFG